MAKTSIEWTDRSWNFLRGCSLKSTGCEHCYAMIIAHRFNYPGGTYEGLTEVGPNGPRWNGNVRVVEDKIMEPFHVRKPQKWFVNSMSDLFHEDVPFDVIDRAFAVMALTPHHTYQILTKRPELMLEYMGGLAKPGDDLAEFEEELVERWGAAAGDLLDGPWIHNDGKRFRDKIEAFISHCMGMEPDGEMLAEDSIPFPLPNVWLGVSAENQKYWDERVEVLGRVPAAVRFVSIEPQLGPIDVGNVFETGKIHWLIVGGESGPSARPFDIQWPRDIVAHCKPADVACFVKQFGAKAYSAKDMIIGKHFPREPADYAIRLPLGKYQVLQDGHGGDMSEWPEDLRVREFPSPVHTGG